MRDMLLTTSPRFIVQPRKVQQQGLGGVRSEKIGIATRGDFEGSVKVVVVLWSEVIGGAVQLIFFAGIHLF